MEAVATGAMLLNDTRLRIGTSIGLKSHMALRFPLAMAGWLVGKNISDVSLKLTFFGGSGNAGTFDATAHFEDSATSSWLSATASDISNRSRTTASVEFGSATITSPNPGEVKSYSGDGTNLFLTCVNELIDSHGAANIDSLTFLLIHSGTGIGYRHAYAADFGANQPQLVITYTEVSQLDERKSTLLRLDEERVRL